MAQWVSPFIPVPSPARMRRASWWRRWLDGYRSFVEPGVLQIEQYTDEPSAYDRVANDVTIALADNGETHLRYDVYRHSYRWMREVSEKCSLTPESVEHEVEPRVPVRKPALPLWRDGGYWSDRYCPTSGIVFNPEPTWSPPLLINLMQALAEDFPAVPGLSSAARLVFMQAGDAPLAWAILFEKIDGGRDFRFPPRLVLCKRPAKGKLRQDAILFEDVLTRVAYSMVHDARGVELILRFSLPRFRRAIAFYEPLVAAACTA